MSANCNPTLRQRLDGLAAFLPLFEASGFQFGGWSEMTKTESGAFLMPTYLTSEVGSSFIAAVHDLGWVLPGFDWMAWARTPEAEQLRDVPDAMDHATADQLAQLLTVIARQDRFSEGELGACYKSGLLTRILRRAATLRAELA
jgi:hypothetical protein